MTHDILTARDEVCNALNHKAGRIPLDLGASPVSGMHVSIVYKLRQALGLDEPGTPVKVIEPFQMLGEIKPDIMDRLGVDVVGLGGSGTIFGFKNENWKEWLLPGGTPVLVPEKFNTRVEPNGELLMYPEGDVSSRPSGRKPKGGWFFDAIIRQEPINTDELNIENNLEEFQPISEDELTYFKRAVEHAIATTDKAIVANFGGTSFGDIALVPAPWLKNPKGIRDIEEWYVSLSLRKDYIFHVFERQCAIALANLERIFSVVGNNVDVVYMSGTDFGTQSGLFISKECYKTLFKPFQKILNDWVHKNTSWKTFMHSCGSVVNLLDEFIDAGFDIINPVQCSAFGMKADELKHRFGDNLVFWGGGIDTQHTLPFGTPEDVKVQVFERIRDFGKNGGFVFNSIHNIQAGTPIENVIAFFDAYKKHRDMYA